MEAIKVEIIMCTITKEGMRITLLLTKANTCFRHYRKRNIIFGATASTLLIIINKAL